MTYSKLQEIVVDSGGLSTITFSNIVQNFTHLRLHGSLRSNRTVTVGDDTLLRFNGDTASNYAYSHGSFGSLGAGTSISATSLFGLMRVTTSANTANFFCGVDIFISNYSSTTLTKFAQAIAGFGDGTSPSSRLGQGSWNSTAAITSISIAPNIGTLFTQYSQVTLYGIR